MSTKVMFFQRRSKYIVKNRIESDRFVSDLAISKLPTWTRKIKLINKKRDILFVPYLIPP